MPGYWCQSYYTYEPIGGLGAKVDYIACQTVPGFGPEVRALLKPPDLYAGGPLKIRHWTFFPTAASRLWQTVPTPEALPIGVYAWWLPDPYTLGTGFFGVAPTLSSATHTTSNQVKNHPLVALVPDPAAGAWGDGKLLYLWYSIGTATIPNEFGIFASELMWGL